MPQGKPDRLSKPGELYTRKIYAEGLDNTMKSNSIFSEDVSEARIGTGVDAGDDELRAMNALEAGIRKGVPASRFKDTLEKDGKIRYNIKGFLLK